MRKYRVTITETLELAVCVMAESRDEAERKARDRWKNRPHILGADNFTGVVFEAVPAEESCGRTG